tara:strand:+ start:59 stop:1480 length:1422 start_codon:yes stop_codon:yes gene_type:complete
MISKLRSFSSSKFAGVLVAIIIIPFVFWGMGSVFSGGNTNNVAKINNKTISTQDFVDHINKSGMNLDIIKKNIDNNILEKILSELVSNKLLDIEINDLELFISDKSLVNKIKFNEVFKDDKNNFSRIKYEKFLLENNLIASDFENRFKNQELKKKLFNFISGGVKSPYFLQNDVYINENKIVNLDYFNLNNSYETEVTAIETEKFIEENKEKLKIDYIDFLYTKITPKNLIEIEEFNKDFYKKIDDIENKILNGFNFKEIAKEYNLNIISKKKYKNNNNENEILKEIYSKRGGEKVQLIDKNDYFILFEINKINKILPNNNDQTFIDNIKKQIILKKKFDLHQQLFEKIQEKKINDKQFVNIAKNQVNILSIKINGIYDNSKFDSDSVKLLYSLPKNSFTLITDDKNNIYLAKINNIISENLLKDDPKIKDYQAKTNNKIINDIYNSYDLSLNSKYKVKIFENTLDRVKNYFK